MTVEAQEMQHHARLLRCERDKWQRHFGILAIARRIHGQRDVPADHPELHALLISVRQVSIDRLAHDAERGAAIRGERRDVFGYAGSGHARDDTRRTVRRTSLRTGPPLPVTVLTIVLSTTGKSDREQ